MKEENRKEILTREAIRQDLKKVYKVGILSCVMHEIVMVCCYFVAWCWFKIFSIENTTILNCLFTVLGLLGVIYIALYIRKINLIQKDRYYIVSDTLLGVEDKDAIPHMLFYKLYKLHFSSYGVYEIPNRKIYEWSQNHNMTDNDLFNYSNAGDSFYLVAMDNKKILVVYNKKIFELDENL